MVKKIWTDLSSVLLQFTCVTDGRTDRQTAFSSLDRICIPCSVVKTCTYQLCKRQSECTNQPILIIGKTANNRLIIGKTADTDYRCISKQ